MSCVILLVLATVMFIQSVSLTIIGITGILFSAYSYFVFPVYRKLSTVKLYSDHIVFLHKIEFESAAEVIKIPLLGVLVFSNQSPWFSILPSVAMMNSRDEYNSAVNKIRRCRKSPRQTY